MSLTIKAALSQARSQLAQSRAATPALDAEVLLSHVTCFDRAGLYREWQRTLTPEQESEFFAVVNERLSGVPVAYLTGHKEFMGLEFAVNPFVLIPRPETELLVEEALRLAPAGAVIVDVGTGSGAVAVSLAFYRPDVRVYATDQSSGAIDTAQLNAGCHGVGDRITFFRGDLLEPLSGLNLTGRVDLLAANLPYIPTGDLPSLPREVRLFEPESALDGGADGLELYRRLFPDAADMLRPGGILLAEIGCGQSKAVGEILKPPLWNVTILKDLAGRDRLVSGRKMDD
ncbi:MAG: Release factor glutamine methyltransferase [Pelotomaculum sp. PtaB.Bin104]|nr:MAG: Release factor glutamine methyltransferase [Pelotomaculum sp. PtaB.Bin104]